MKLLILTKDMHNRELEYIKEMATGNGYNVSLFNEILTKHKVKLNVNRGTTLACIIYTKLDRISIMYYPKIK